MDRRGVERTTVREHDMQICHSLKSRHIDMSTAERLISIFRNNAGTPLWTLRSNAATLQNAIRLCAILHLAATITSKLVFDFN